MESKKTNIFAERAGLLCQMIDIEDRKCMACVSVCNGEKAIYFGALQPSQL